MTLLESTPFEFKVVQELLNPKHEKCFFHPLYKKKMWNGRINFFYQPGNLVSVGLWKLIKDYCKEHNFELKIKGLKHIFDLDFNEDEFSEWFDEYTSNSFLEIRDYQVNVVLSMLKYKRGVIDSATGSGKTFIMFMFIAFLLDTKRIKRCMIVVPNLDLMNQTMAALYGYDESNMKGEEGRFRIQRYGDNNKGILEEDTNVVVGTFQTLCKFDSDFYNQFDCIIVDESHTAKAKSIGNILKQASNAYYRFGLSGTSLVKGRGAISLGMQELFGPMLMKISVNRLQQEGYISPCNIEIHKLNYLSDEYRHKLIEAKKVSTGSQLFNIERKLARMSDIRLKHIVKCVTEADNNTLVLFTDIKNGYGKKIYKEILNNTNGVVCHYIDGSVSGAERERIRNEINNDKSETRHVLVASFMTTSTGIDIKSLSTLILTESYKNLTIILQSIGRTLRVAEGKEYATVIDITDDFSFTGNKRNFLLKHSEDRKKIYDDEKLKYIEKDFDYRSVIHK